MSHLRRATQPPPPRRHPVAPLPPFLLLAPPPERSLAPLPFMLSSPLPPEAGAVYPAAAILPIPVSLCCLSSFLLEGRLHVRLSLLRIWLPSLLFHVESWFLMVVFTPAEDQADGAAATRSGASTEILLLTRVLDKLRAGAE